MITEGPLEKLTFEEVPQGEEGVNEEENSWQRENKCTAEVSVFGSNKEASVTGLWWEKTKVLKGLQQSAQGPDDTGFEGSDEGLSFYSRCDGKPVSSHFTP